MWHLKAWFSGGCGNTGLMPGLNDLKGHFQPKWFCDSTCRYGGGAQDGLNPEQVNAPTEEGHLNSDLGLTSTSIRATAMGNNSGTSLWNWDFLKQNKISECLLGEEVVQKSCCAPARTLLYCKRASLFRQAQRDVDICNVYLIFPSLLFLLFWCSLRLWRFKITFFPETTSLKTKIKQLEIACCQSD